MRISMSIVGALLLAVLAQAGGFRKVGPCRHLEQYAPPDPATILVPPLVVRQVYGRAVVEARDKVIPINEVGGVCLSLFTEKTHRFVANTTADKHGRFRFPVNSPGEYRLVSRARGFCTGNTRIEVVSSKEARGKAGVLVHIRIHEVDGCSYADYDHKAEHPNK